MAPARKRSAKSAAIPQSAIGQTATALQALPEKEKEALSLREAVTHLQEPIRTALGRGYSYEEVTSMLADQGINISVFSLKRYLSLTRSKSEDGAVNGRGKGKPRRARKSVEDAPTVTEQPEVEAAAPVAEPTPEAEPKRRRKTTKPEATAPEKTKTAAKSKSTTRTTARSSAARGRKKSVG